MNIPIIYYHSIANHSSHDPWGFLSIGREVFVQQIQLLKKKGYYACDWQELADHFSGKKQLPHKTIMFHFDDGFLDNWSVVFPIMKDAGFKYSVLITPEFIQKGDKVRPFVQETKETNKNFWWGYLNEKEIKVMAKSGLVDFQSHGYTHTWYPCGDEIIDLYNGTDFYPHLHWNLHTSKKANWLGNIEQLPIPKGYPIFEYKKSLSLDKVFIPNPNFIEDTVKLYDDNLSKEQNLLIVKELKAKYNKEDNLGRFETKYESQLRVKKELLESKEYISLLTGKPCEYIVYPGGGLTDNSFSLSREYGYKLVSKGKALNAYGTGNFQVFRQSAVYPFTRMSVVLNNIFLRFQLARGEGNKFFEKISKILKG